MSTLSKKAKALVDYFSGRYECFVAETEDQIAELQAIRSEVFGDELHRFGEAGSTAIALEDEFNISIPDSEVANILTFTLIVYVVKEAINLSSVGN